jgi:antitoxin CcdA
MTTTIDRRPTNVTLPTALVEEAKALGINLSRACESGLQAALSAERTRLWKADNAGAIADYNQWIEDHGLPLEEYRQF